MTQRDIIPRIVLFQYLSRDVTYLNRTEQKCELETDKERGMREEERKLSICRSA